MAESMENRRRSGIGSGLLALSAWLEMKEVPPIRVTRFTNHGRYRQRLRRGRLAQEAQAGLVRESVGLEGVDFLLRPNEVLKRVTTAAIARNDVVQVAALFADELAGVLADAPVAREDRGARDPRGAERHAIELRRD